MRAVFGVVSLLVVLALAALLVAKQLKAVRPASGTGELSGSSSSSSPTGSGSSVNGNVHGPSQPLQQRVTDDVARALEQGAASRADAADQ